MRRGSLHEIGIFGNAFVYQIGIRFPITLVVFFFKSDKILYDF